MLIEINEEQATAILFAGTMLRSTKYQKESDILVKLGTECIDKVAQENFTTKEMEQNQEMYREAFDKWASIKGATLSYFEIEKVCQFVNEFGKQWVLEAMDITGEQGKCKLGYTHTILNNWKSDGKGENEDFVKKQTSVNELAKKWRD